MRLLKEDLEAGKITPERIGQVYDCGLLQAPNGIPWWDSNRPFKVLEASLEKDFNIVAKMGSAAHYELPRWRENGRRHSVGKAFPRSRAGFKRWDFRSSDFKRVS